MTWLFLMHNKKGCVDLLNNLFSFIHTQFNKHVKAIRSNNAKELCASRILQIYNTLGISYQRSCSENPQQNGTVERKHRHSLETARALCFQSNLSSSFWGECVLCATYLINRLPLTSLGNISPYQKLFGTPNLLII